MFIILNLIVNFCTALVQDLPDDDLLNETDKLDHKMKVLDGYSDHGSDISGHGSNFSRSRSLSGSFSVELSNLSGSSLGIYPLQLSF